MREDSRYPYTYAADYVRALGGYNKDGTKLSRADASAIRSSIASVIGMDDAELARRLADHYKASEAEVGAKSFADFLSAQGMEGAK